MDTYEVGKSLQTIKLVTASAGLSLRACSSGYLFPASKGTSLEALTFFQVSDPVLFPILPVSEADRKGIRGVKTFGVWNVV